MSAGGYERMRAAMQVVQAAWKHGAPTVPVAVRALEDAQLLQSPETAAENETLRKRLAALEAAPTTVYRAQHDSIPMGHYTNLAAAQAHCEAKVRQEEPAGSIKALDWWADPDDDQPAYELSIIPVDTSSGMRTTGYFVTPLLVDSEFDEDGDE